MNRMKSLIKISVLLVVIVTLASCKKDSAPNYQFMPNMYAPISYETFGESKAFANGIEAQLSAEGTISRGHSLFEYDNTIEGYTLAKETLKNPLDSTQIDLDNTKVLYEIYCGICHGVKGDGQGNLVKREKILGIPRYDDPARAINEGSIYHTVYYGKNAMGSHAGQVNATERWQIAQHVMYLRNELTK